MPSVRCMQKVGMGNKGQATNWKQGADCMGRTGPQSGLEELGKAAHGWGGDGMCAPSAQAENDLRWTGCTGQSIMALQQACGLALACNWYLRINYCYDLTNGTYTFDPILGRWTQRRQSLGQAWLT